MRRFAYILIILCALSVAEAKAITLRDSLMTELKSMPDDSLKLRKAYIYAQQNLDRFWALDIIDMGIESSIKQNHFLWELAFRGSKIRWTHRHHDWERMERFIEEQHEAAFKYNHYGNHFSQVAQSVLVLNGMGKYEKAWSYIERMKRDMERAGGNVLREHSIYMYIVQADYYYKRGERRKGIDCYLAALNDTTLITSPEQRVSFCIGLIDAFAELGQYEQALAQADSVEAIYETYYSEDKRNLPNSRTTLVECLLSKAEVYGKIGDYDKMRECIMTAETYRDALPHPERAAIYRAWEHYYNDIGDHQHSLTNIDRAVKEFLADGYTEAAIQMEIERMVPMWAMGEREEVVDQYCALLERLDIMHQDLISVQQDFLDEQTEILHQQQRSTNMRTWASYVVIGITVVLALFAISMLIYGLITYRTVRKNHRITRHKLREAKVADRAKENFLRNITNLINEPLQHVVKDAKQLATDRSLSSSEQQTLVRHSKEHVARLMALVNNVLDLSRLEACMMKYTLKEVDLVEQTEMCVQEFLSNQAFADNPEEAAATTITVEKQVDSFVKQSDTTRFTNMLTSLFVSPVDHVDKKPEHIHIVLSSPSKDKLLITITGSMFSDESDFTEAERMTNSINRYIMRDFKGGYDVSPERILITVIR